MSWIEDAARRIMTRLSLPCSDMGERLIADELTSAYMSGRSDALRDLDKKVHELIVGMDGEEVEEEGDHPDDDATRRHLESMLSAAGWKQNATYPTTWYSPSGSNWAIFADDCKLDEQARWHPSSHYKSASALMAKLGDE